MRSVALEGKVGQYLSHGGVEIYPVSERADASLSEGKLCLVMDFVVSSAMEVCDNKAQQPPLISWIADNQLRH